MVWQNGYKLLNSKYIIEQELGQDGFSVTYKAKHTELNSTIVSKTLNNEAASTMTPEIDLHSERGVDYTRLRDLLAAGNWEEADYETVTVMLKVSGREEEGWLNADSIKNFPCSDIRTIDQLWGKYSNGRFGFSIQKRIWQKVNEDWNAWCESVDWSVREPMIFSLNAPAGHLPGGGWCLGGGSLQRGNSFLKTIALLNLPGGEIWGLAISSLASRFGEGTLQ